MVIPPILNNKHTSMPLDPDGDVVRHLRQNGLAKPFSGWPCYHTETRHLRPRRAASRNSWPGRRRAPFAVLVAEELFASACKLLVSLTSAGQIVSAGNRLTLS
jgi:hypothetical protein